MSIQSEYPLSSTGDLGAQHHPKHPGANHPARADVRRESRVRLAHLSGLGLGRVTSARIDDQGTLIVTAQNPQWKREVERSFALIRSRLDALLGPDAFIKVEIIHG